MQMTQCYGIEGYRKTDRQIDREFTKNRQDITINNKTKKTCKLTGVAIAADRNILKKKAGKMLKYKGLSQ
jgi:hypothetical protein